ncbi:hypothetical protein ACQZV8_14660 [Magnetococcales bacterium HHB-1]
MKPITDEPWATRYGAVQRLCALLDPIPVADLKHGLKDTVNRLANTPDIVETLFKDPLRVFFEASGLRVVSGPKEKHHSYVEDDVIVNGPLLHFVLERDERVTNNSGQHEFVRNLADQVEFIISLSIVLGIGMERTQMMVRASLKSLNGVDQKYLRAGWCSNYLSYIRPVLESSLLEARNRLFDYIFEESNRVIGTVMLLDVKAVGIPKKEAGDLEGILHELAKGKKKIFELFDDSKKQKKHWQRYGLGQFLSTCSNFHFQHQKRLHEKLDDGQITFELLDGKRCHIPLPKLEEFQRDIKGNITQKAPVFFAALEALHNKMRKIYKKLRWNYAPEFSVERHDAIERALQNDCEGISFFQHESAPDLESLMHMWFQWPADFNPEVPCVHVFLYTKCSEENYENWQSAPNTGNALDDRIKETRQFDPPIPCRIETYRVMQDLIMMFGLRDREALPEPSSLESLQYVKERKKEQAISSL